MFRNKEKSVNRLDRTENERLDAIGSEMARAAQLSDAEIKEAVTSPFLYARVRASIQAREKNNWRTLLLTARRPLAGMALTAVIAASLFLFTTGIAQRGAVTQPAGDEDVLAIGEPDFERAVFTGTDTLTNDEVLKTLMEETDGQR